MLTSENQLKEFYYDFRSICKPPMVKIADLEIGELWFYDGLALSVTCCLGEKHLLVAYDIYGPKEQAINQFLDAYSRLGDEEYKRPLGMFLVFAAREKEDGTLDVSLFSPGDWSGLPYYRHTLPESEHKYPHGWD
jgi:hypothetical protein